MWKSKQKLKITNSSDLLQKKLADRKVDYENFGVRA